MEVKVVPPGMLRGPPLTTIGGGNTSCSLTTLASTSAPHTTLAQSSCPPGPWSTLSPDAVVFRSSEQS